MGRVWLTGFGIAHPRHRVGQEEAAARIGDATGESRRVAAIARGTRIKERAVVLPPEMIGELGSIEERNLIYQRISPDLAVEAAAQLLARPPAERIGMLATASCTGYMIPGLDVEVARRLNLDSTAAHLPITEAGCSGGVVAMARVADFLRVHPDCSGLAIAVEICSLAFHPRPEAGNLTSVLLFGDGAGAALLETGDPARDSLEVVDSLSFLIPDTQDAIGFALTDRGFYPVLSSEIAELLPEPMLAAVTQLLCRNALNLSHDVGFWLVHPGGPRILEAVQATFELGSEDLRWSWLSLQEFGNTSSAAIFDVFRRYAEDEDRARGWGVVAGFGPGVSIELLLVRR
jgi:alkylresorcinol/alkylpyrone synthase